MLNKGEDARRERGHESWMSAWTDLEDDGCGVMLAVQCCDGERSG